MTSLQLNNKLRGGYYTPKPIADFLAKWAIQSGNLKILEPSCGDGVIIESCVEALLKLNSPLNLTNNPIYGIEIYDGEAQKAVKRLKKLNVSESSFNIFSEDFFKISQTWFNSDQRFDVIIGNPPFIRYQNFPEDQREIAFKLMHAAGLHPNRLTNTWVAFLVISSLLLKESGKLAMVIPAELFQVNYAAEIRKFLSDYFKRIGIINFNKLVFDGIQQEIVLLLCEKNNSSHEGIAVIEIEDLADLPKIHLKDFTETELKPIDHTSEKWTKYFLTTNEILFLRELKNHPKIQLSGEAIDVDVGIVTGQNKFFILNEKQLNTTDLKQYSHEIVTRSPHLKGAIFSQSDWKENCRNQYPSFLFTPPNAPFDKLPVPVQKYILKGENERINQGYKCRIRNLWYIVPSIWTPDAFMLRQVNKFPKLVLNSSSATCTDTIHRVKFLNGYDGRIVTAAFLNSLTFAFSEITGRSYGGGVLTFEPSECERLPISLIGAENLDLEEIDKLLRENKIRNILDITDKLLLIKGLGLTVKEANLLRGIWEKLRDRRINRKNTRKKPVHRKQDRDRRVHLLYSAQNRPKGIRRIQTSRPQLALDLKPISQIKADKKM